MPYRGLRAYMVYMGQACTGHTRAGAVVDRVSAGGPREREGMALAAAAGIEAHGSAWMETGGGGSGFSSF